MKRNVKIVILLCLLLLMPVVQVAAKDLAEIKQAGVLRVGTTGDYPPLTVYDVRKDLFSGTDVQMARQLAEYLKVKIQFIKTSWVTLNQDLLAGKFDIAVGGISASEQRRKMFLLSTPIEQSGKVPLIRCSDVGKYQTVTAINQPTVRVVENQGGTNQQFAQQYLPQAQLNMVVNSEDAFQYLLQQKADVMITDSTEAIYRQHSMPGLCAVNPQHPFTYDVKIFLLPKNSPYLLSAVNFWIINLR